MSQTLSCVSMPLGTWAEVRCTHTMHSLTCVSVVVCVVHKPRPCLSYSRRRDRINSVLWRSYYKGGALQVGPQWGQDRMLMSPEGCHHLPIHSRNSRLRLATATNHQVYEDPCDACINASGFPPSSLARFQCVGTACSAHAVRTHCTNLALAQGWAQKQFKCNSPNKCPPCTRGASIDRFWPQTSTQPQITEKLDLHRQTENGTAKFHGSPRCGTNTSCCSNRTVVFARGARDIRISWGDAVVLVETRNNPLQGPQWQVKKTTFLTCR